jgi:hypothetical protein
MCSSFTVCPTVVSELHCTIFWHTLSDPWPVLYSATCCKNCRYRQPLFYTWDSWGDPKVTSNVGHTPHPPLIQQSQSIHTFSHSMCQIDRAPSCCNQLHRLLDSYPTLISVQKGCFQHMYPTSNCYHLYSATTESCKNYSIAPCSYVGPGRLSYRLDCLRMGRYWSWHIDRATGWTVWGWAGTEVGILTELLAGLSEYQILARAKYFSFSKTSRPALGPNQLPACLHGVDRDNCAYCYLC